jgi:dolichol-phosphate mannosyltransferase
MSENGTAHGPAAQPGGGGDDSTIDYSIVIPVYYNEGELRPTFEALHRDVISRHPELTAEIVFVDDGSGDGSLAELLELRRENPSLVKVLKLTRNFGQPNARLAGLSHARGRCVISISADGQDPAALLNDMLHAHFDEGYEVVICARSGREESLYRSLTSRVFYGLMRRLRFQNMPPGGFDLVLLGRKALRVILRNQEANPFFQGQILWSGFQPKILEYRRLSRKVGVSRWSFSKKLKLMLDAVMCYSYAPIRWISASGILIAFLGFVFAAALIAKRLIWGTQVEGWTALVVIVLMTSGVQMLMIGLLGEYQWRALAQARDRDPYVIDEIYGGEAPDRERGGEAAGEPGEAR